MRNVKKVTIATLLGLAAIQASGCGESTAPAPALGALSVVVSTQGVITDLDPDGYLLTIDGMPSQSIEVNATVTLANLRIGRHVAQLEGLSSNCAVSGLNPRSFDVVENSSVSVSFFVACAAKRGTLQISTTTTGVDPDVDGYWLALNLEDSNVRESLQVRATGSVTIPLMRAGTYLISMYGVAANCDIEPPAPRTVVVVAEHTTAAALSFRCEAPRRLAFVRGVGAATDIHVVNSNGTGAAQLTGNPTADLDPAWSPDGTKLVFASDRDGTFEIYVMDADGTNVVRLTTAPGSDVRPVWSPDGRRIAFLSNRDGVSDIYVMNSDGTNTVRLTNDAFADADPAWSPDGRQIAFQSERDGITAIWVMNADGSSAARLTTGERGERHPAWSPDGTKIAFSRGTPDMAQDIYFVNADGSGLTQLTRGLARASDPAWSPNGRQIAFTGEGYYEPSEISIVSTVSEAYSVSAASPSSNPTWRP